tara:strand:+ start:500 stop:724 length:225 start_codon:yes stop_codon:yes gene_type:complete
VRRRKTKYRGFTIIKRSWLEIGTKRDKPFWQIIDSEFYNPVEDLGIETVNDSLEDAKWEIDEFYMLKEIKSEVA